MLKPACTGRMAKVELGGNADAVEFCPNEPYLHVLAAASYTLQEGRGHQDGPVRLGGLYLFSANQQADQFSPTLGLTKLYHHETSGVFDVKWRPYDDGTPCLAEASADGSLRLHMLREGPDPSSLKFHDKAAVEVSTSMCLYVEWDPTYSNPQVALSHSDGSISSVSLGQSEPEISSSWQAHDFEAWVVTYDAWKTQVVYSGGDDCQFCSWDLRADPSCPVFRDKKSHQMGVCSIQSNPLWENMLITGSYDENVRLWDLRMIQKPLMKIKLGLGGGVWRLKWHHAENKLFLAACMHNGAAIARVGEGGIQLLEQYKEHTSLTYGGSWFICDCKDSLDFRHDVSKGFLATYDDNFCSTDGADPGPNVSDHVPPHDEVMVSREEVKSAEPMLKGGDTLSGKVREENSLQMETLVATCSFYDKALHLWRPKTLAFGLR